MSETNQRTKTLRKAFEEWKEVLVCLHSLLTWEKQFYAGIIASVITFIYLLIWYIDPAVLTLFAFTGIVLTLVDFLIPQVVPMIFKPDQWTGAQERKYDQVVSSLAGICDSVTWFFSSMHDMKVSRPKMFFIVVTTSLLMCAWIGRSVNNFFLTYLIVLLVFLFPGLQRQKMVKNWLDTIGKNVKGVFNKSTADNDKSTKKE